MSMMQKLMEINDEAVRLRAECEQLRSDQKTLQEICAVGRQRITELEAERDVYVLKVSLLEGQIKSLQAELDAARKQLQAACAGYSTTTTLPPKSTGSGLLRDVSHYTEAAEVDTPVADDAPAKPVKVPVKVQEGWWSQRGHGEVYVRPTSSSPDNEPKRTKGYVWSDGVRLYLDNGRHSKDGQTPHDLVKFLGKHLKATNQKADDAPTEPENCGFEGKILQEVSQPVQVQEVTLSAYVVGDTVSPGALRIVWATEEWIEQSKFGIVHAMKDVMFLDHDRFTDREQFSLTLKLNKQ